MISPMSFTILCIPTRGKITIRFTVGEVVTRTQRPNLISRNTSNGLRHYSIIHIYSRILTVRNVKNLYIHAFVIELMYETAIDSLGLSDCNRV